VTARTSTYSTDSDRRNVAVRRDYTWQTLIRCICAPRRTTSRRRQDRPYPTIDTFDGAALTLAILLTVFSLLDALFTLTLLQRGGTELNPLMRYFIETGGTGMFLLAKLLLTAVPAVLMVAMQNVVVFGRWRVRSVLAALVGGYAGLLVYELMLLSLS